jgi:hypothetical protein
MSVAHHEMTRAIFILLFSLLLAGCSSPKTGTPGTASEGDVVNIIEGGAGTVQPVSEMNTAVEHMELTVPEVSPSGHFIHTNSCVINTVTDVTNCNFKVVTNITLAWPDNPCNDRFYKLTGVAWWLQGSTNLHDWYGLTNSCLATNLVRPVRQQEFYRWQPV